MGTFKCRTTTERACFSPCGDSANRPRSTRRRSADLAWLCCRPTRSTFLPTLPAGARPHQHRCRLVARPSRGLSLRVQIPWRASSGEPADRPRSTCALADLVWLSSRPTRGALHPVPLDEAPLQRHRARSAAAASNCRDYNFKIPWCVARARFAPWRTGRPPKEQGSRSADLSRLCCGPTQSTFLPTLSAGNRSHQYRGTLAARPFRGLGHRI